MSSSSTSSSSAAAGDRPWRWYFLRFAGAFCFLLAGTYAFIVLLDPFDVLNLSPDLKRRPVSARQRYVHPSLARKARYDSCVLGASNLRLLRPKELNEALGGSFANLCMNAATRYEQRAVLDVFLRHHPRARAVVLGVDGMWLDTPYMDQRHLYSWFPEWMYDDDPWNDYAHHFDLYALEMAWRQLLQVLGRKKPRFAEDGYEAYLPDESEFDPDEALARMAQDGVLTALAGFGARDEQLRYELEDLEQLLRGMPPATEKVLLLPPFYAAGEVDLSEAKRGLVEVARGFENIRILDFAIESPITETLARWWDRVHYSRSVASEMCRLIGASRAPDFESDACRVLLRR